MTLPRAAGAAAVLLMLAAACGGDPDRPSVLADLADEIVIPAYEEFRADAGELSTATSRLCSDPSDGALSGARAALAEARGGWSYLGSMRVGPVMDRRSWAVVRWPVAVAEIEDLIADSSIELDRDRLANRIGADQRGLGAVEHLLYDSGAPGTADVVAALDDPRRCAYLRGVTEVIAEEASVVAAGWASSWDGGEPYREQFSEAGGEGLDSVVNDVLFLLESITDLELGAALGAMGSAPRPEAIDEGPAGAGVEDLVDRLDGARAVLIGGGDQPESGLAPLLGEDLAGRLKDQFVTARAAAETLEPTLRAAVVHSPAAVAAARDAIKAIQITVATEVVGRLGVTIGFSDADGDSSG